MEVFRIHNAAFAALDGTGAAITGARWNHPGSAVVYAALTYEGAILEQLVHAGIGRLPKNRVVSRIGVPASVRVETLDDMDDAAWADETLTRAIGTEWLDERSSVALIVPAAVARPFGKNVLISPAHPDFEKIEILETAPVQWDPRFSTDLPGDSA